MRMPWSGARKALAANRVLCPSPAPIGIETHESALRIAEKYGYEIYDALIAASALEAGCAILYSERLAHREVLEGRLLTARNPLRTTSRSSLPRGSRIAAREVRIRYVTTCSFRVRVCVPA